jgi:hypothetical protein
MLQVCSARPAPPSALNPAVNRTLDLIVARALEKDPEARYADAGAMAADLKGALTDLAAATPRVPPSAIADVAHESTAAQRAPDHERTVAIGGATLAAPIAGLHVLARFDSQAALLRLAEPQGRDRQLMSPSAEPAPLIRRWFVDGSVWGAAALLVGALGLAWAIAR